MMDFVTIKTINVYVIGMEVIVANVVTVSINCDIVNHVRVRILVMSHHQ